MRIEILSREAQDGLRQWAKTVEDDELLFDGISTENWAWMWFRLRSAEDRPAWFPKGKSATLQFIEEQLLREARA